MHGYVASLLDHERWSERWTGHNSPCTARDHTLHKFIDYEQINLCWMMTGQKQLDPRLNPTVKPFSPQNHQEKTQNISTENINGIKITKDNNNTDNATKDNLEDMQQDKIKTKVEQNEQWIDAPIKSRRKSESPVAKRGETNRHSALDSGDDEDDKNLKLDMNQLDIDSGKACKKEECKDYDADSISIEDLDSEIEHQMSKDMGKERIARETLCNDLKHAQHLNRHLSQRVKDLEVTLDKSDKSLEQLKVKEEECERKDNEIAVLIAKAQEIESYSKVIEEDFKSVIKEGDDRINDLKKQQHKKTINHHCALKDIDNYKSQAQKLKNTLDKERKQSVFLRETLNENESARARLTNELEEAHVKMKKHEEMKSHAVKLESVLVMKCHAIIYLRRKMKEHENS